MIGYTPEGTKPKNCPCCKQNIVT